MTKSYDKILNDRLVFAARLREGSGLITGDSAKSSLRHTMTLTGTPSWGSLANGQPYLDFNQAHPDYLQCSAAGSTDLQFTGQRLPTMAIWVKIDNTVADMVLVRKGLTNTDGWCLWVVMSGGTLRFIFRTYSGGGSQQSFTDTYTDLTQWYFYVVAAHGDAWQYGHYVNGINKSISGFHNVLSAANRKFLIGIDNDEVASPFDGKIASVRIWSRTLLPSEIKELYDREKKWFR